MVRGKRSEVTALLLHPGSVVDPAVAVGDSPCGRQSAIGQHLLLTLRRARLPPCWLSPACAGRPVRGETQHFSSGPCFLSPMQLHMDMCGEPSLLFAGRACASVGELPLPLPRRRPPSACPGTTSSRPTEHREAADHDAARVVRSGAPTGSRLGRQRAIRCCGERALHPMRASVGSDTGRGGGDPKSAIGHARKRYMGAKPGANLPLPARAKHLPPPGPT